MKGNDWLLLGGLGLAAYLILSKKQTTPAADLGGFLGGAIGGAITSPLQPLVTSSMETAGTAYQDILSRFFGAGVSATVTAQQTAAKLPIIGGTASAALEGATTAARIASSNQILAATAEGYRPAVVSYAELAPGQQATAQSHPQGLTPIVQSWTAPTAATINSQLSQNAATALRLATGRM